MHNFDRFTPEVPSDVLSEKTSSTIRGEQMQKSVFFFFSKPMLQTQILDTCIPAASTELDQLIALLWLQEMISQQIMWLDQIIHIFDLAKAFSTRYPKWCNLSHLSRPSERQSRGRWLGRSPVTRTQTSPKSFLQRSYLIYNCYAEYLPASVSGRCSERVFSLFWLQIGALNAACCVLCCVPPPPSPKAVNSCCLTTAEASQLQRTMQRHFGREMRNGCRLYKLPP